MSFIEFDHPKLGHLVLEKAQLFPFAFDFWANEFFMKKRYVRVAELFTYCQEIGVKDRLLHGVVKNGFVSATMENGIPHNIGDHAFKYVNETWANRYFVHGVRILTADFSGIVVEDPVKTALNVIQYAKENGDTLSEYSVQHIRDTVLRCGADPDRVFALADVVDVFAEKRNSSFLSAQALNRGYRIVNQANIVLSIENKPWTF